MQRIRKRPGPWMLMVAFDRPSSDPAECERLALKVAEQSEALGLKMQKHWTEREVLRSIEVDGVECEVAP